MVDRYLSRFGASPQAVTWMVRFSSLVAAIAVLAMISRGPLLISGSQVTRLEVIDECGRVLRILRPLLTRGDMSWMHGPAPRFIDRAEPFSDAGRWVFTTGIMSGGDAGRIAAGQTMVAGEVVTHLARLQRFLMAHLRHPPRLIDNPPSLPGIGSNEALIDDVQLLVAAGALPTGSSSRFDARRRVTVRELRAMGQALLDYFGRDQVVAGISPQGVRLLFKGTIREVSSDQWLCRADGGEWGVVPADGRLAFAGRPPRGLVLRHGDFEDVVLVLGREANEYIVFTPLRRKSSVARGAGNLGDAAGRPAGDRAASLIDRLRQRLQVVKRDLAAGGGAAVPGAGAELVPPRPVVVRSGGEVTPEKQARADALLARVRADAHENAGPNGGEMPLPRLQNLRERLHSIVGGAGDPEPRQIAPARVPARVRPVRLAVAPAPAPTETSGKILFEARVLDGLSNEPICGANVLVDREVLATDEEGLFGCNLSNGELVELLITAEGYQSLTIKHRVAAVTELPSFTLKPMVGRLIGQVVDAVTGEVLPQARVQINGGAVLMTDLEGSFVIPRIKSGNVRIGIARAGYQELSLPTFVGEGSTRRQFRLTRESGTP